MSATPESMASIREALSETITKNLTELLQSTQESNEALKQVTMRLGQTILAMFRPFSLDSVLLEPAQVDNATFNPGVEVRYVIEAAQRNYRHRHAARWPLPFPDRFSAGEIRDHLTNLRAGFEDREFVTLEDYEALRRELEDAKAQLAATRNKVWPFAAS